MTPRALQNFTKKTLALVLVFNLSVIPHIAAAQERTVAISTHDLPAALVVEETRADLARLGCSAAPLPENGSTLIAPLGKTQPVIPSDPSASTLLMCPEGIDSYLTIKGRVDAAQAQAIALTTALLLTYGAVELYNLAAYGTTFTEEAAKDVAGAALTETATWVGDKALLNIAYLAARLGNYLIHKLAFLISILFSANKFATHPFVTSGWPFVLGVANIGFLLALLFIAATTVLRLDVGGGVKRLLPRLLFAALLINFSLLVGSIIIDATRILMAILSRSIGANDVQNLGSTILQRSAVFANALAFQGEIGNNLAPIQPDDVFINPHAATFDLVKTAVVIWLLVVAFFALVAGLFTRYIMLILLLIFSPLAYLALAIPGASSFAKKWWTEFIKYAIYGPAALFIIILVTKIPTNAVENLFGVKSDITVAVESLISVAVTAALLIAAASVGKYMSVAGATAAIGFAGKQGKRLGVKTGKMAAKGAYVGSGARMVVDGVKNNVKDFQSKSGDAVGDFMRNRNSVTKFLAGPRRDSKGNLLPGESSVLGNVADQTFGRLSPTQQQKNAQTKDAKEAISGGLATSLENDDARVSPQMLRQPHVAQALSSANLLAIAEHGSKGHVEAIISNPDVLSKLSTEERVKFQNNINSNTLIQKKAEEGRQAILDTYDLKDPKQKSEHDRKKLELERADKKSLADLVNKFQESVSKGDAPK